MADTKTTPRSTAAKTAAKTRATTATRRSTAAKKGAATKANQSTAEVVAPPASRVQGLAERAVLIPVGVALEARDMVLDTVTSLSDTYASRESAEKQLKKFERRGRSARTKMERDLRQRRKRVERVVKRNRSRVESELAKVRRDVEKQGKQLGKVVSSNVDYVAAQVENTVQSGVTAGAKAVDHAAQDATS